MIRLLFILCVATGVIAQGDADSLTSLLSEADETSFYENWATQFFGPKTRFDNAPSKGLIRQRLVYSPSSSGWTVLNKGHVTTEDYAIHFIIEQDPSEISLSDHAALSLSTDQIPGLTQLIIGNYQTRWGAGFLYDQNQRRRSMGVSSLKLSRALSIRPHYSSREGGFYTGVAFLTAQRNHQASGFISYRQLTGNIQESGFKEDADGVHPAYQTFTQIRDPVIGLSGMYTFSQVSLFLAGVYKEHTGLLLEWGLHYTTASKTSLQIHGDSHGNMLMFGLLSANSLRLSGQLRYLPLKSATGQSTVLTFLPRSAPSEMGVSWRIQARPSKQIVLRGALDHGLQTLRTSLEAHDVSRRKNIQLEFKQKTRTLRVELGGLIHDQLSVQSIDTTEMESSRLSKLALAWYQTLTPTHRYQLAVKVARQGQSGSILIQQVIKWKRNGWRIDLGVTRYFVDDFSVRLSSYESTPLESFGFFTAYDDGQRSFIYARHEAGKLTLELKAVQTRSFSKGYPFQQLALNFQLSIVF